MPSASATWSAIPHARDAVPRAPGHADEGWLPLVSDGSASAADCAAAPGWARLSWEPSALHVDAVFHGPEPRNRATRLNERTWDLGDVCELFIQLPSTRYLEIHVTPENQRLQLNFPLGGIARVRAKEEKLETFQVADPAWVTSRTRLEHESWFTHLTVPAQVLEMDELQAGSRFRAAVCRYQFPPGRTLPVLTTTALLPTPGFHQPEHWNELVLGAGNRN